MKQFIYPADLIPDSEEGGFVVRFIDLPEAITQGENVENALLEAADCLEEAIANRIALNLPIPDPSRIESDRHPVALPARMAAIAALSQAIHDNGISRIELAEKLGRDEKEIRRLLEPHDSGLIPDIETALHAMGRKLIVGVETAA